MEILIATKHSVYFDQKLKSIYYNAALAKKGAKVGTSRAKDSMTNYFAFIAVVSLKISHLDI